MICQTFSALLVDSLSIYIFDTCKESNNYIYQPPQCYELAPRITYLEYLLTGLTRVFQYFLGEYRQPLTENHFE